jgi:hypothetical protein
MGGRSLAGGGEGRVCYRIRSVLCAELMGLTVSAGIASAVITQHLAGRTGQSVFTAFMTGGSFPNGSKVSADPRRFEER